jgi:phage gp46-like protein
LDAHFNFFGELYVSVDDILLNYPSITYEKMIAALVVMLSFVMRQCIELMTAKHAWCCWTLTMVACLAASHLGFAWTSNSMTRSEKRLKRSRRYRMRTQIKALLFASWACSTQAMEGQQGEQIFLLRIANLAEAATSAASAAERALNQLSQAGTAGSSVGGEDPVHSRLSMATKVLRNPDAFNGEDPFPFTSWKFSFIFMVVVW